MHPNSTIHRPPASTRKTERPGQRYFSESAIRFVHVGANAEGKRHAALEERSVRTRSMLILLEPDRLHCWALIVALASSIAGMALIISSTLN
ncbi:hypothetical protein AB4072_11005 [Microvirga sp. 2MCAF38]|uniref:hypothetical protein n=1 Tax=Microvirga sp. 2MCAF38 TaxID=3232989 RepID=UPI003F948A80